MIFPARPRVPSSRFSLTVYPWLHVSLDISPSKLKCGLIEIRPAANLNKMMKESERRRLDNTLLPLKTRLVFGAALNAVER